MPRLIILPFVIFYSTVFSQEKELLLGNWKLQSYEAIEKIRSSPGYYFGDSTSRAQIEKVFKRTLDSTYYEFKKDTLIYTSIEGLEAVIRTALWELSGNTISIKETERNFERQAHLILVNKDTLIITPIIEGKIGSSKMLFTKSD